MSKERMTWKDVFYSGHKWYGSYERCQEAAKAAGYPYYEWNGWVHKVDAEYIGAAFAVCKAEDLK